MMEDGFTENAMPESLEQKLLDAIQELFHDKGVVTHWAVVVETMDEQGRLGIETDHDDAMTSHLQRGMLEEVIDMRWIYEDEEEEG